MQIGIISDTHNNISKTIESLDFFLEKKITKIFHCGDWTSPDVFKKIAIEAHKRCQKIYGVLGNNDIKHRDSFYKINSEINTPINLPKENEDFYLFKHKNRRFAIYHGHDRLRLNELIQTLNLEAVFVGHTHIPKEEFIQKTKVLNPGALSYSIPFKKRNNEIFTVGIYDLEKRNFLVYEI